MVIRRFLEYLNYKGINENRATVDCDLSKGLIGRAKKGYSDLGKKSVEKILKKYQDLNRVWLLTGDGEMLVSEEKKYDVANLSTGEEDNYKLVPLLNIDSVGGVWSANEVVDTSEYVMSLIPFNDAKEGDVAVIQSGDSMTPTVPPGAVLLLRKMEGWKDYIGYGSICVLVLNDGRRITKEIQAYRPNMENYILCVSHKEGIASEPLPKHIIHGVWKVVKILVNYGW